MTAPPAEQVTPAVVVAGTVAAAEVLEAHRVDLETLLGLALAELTAVWNRIVGASPDLVRDALADALPGLVEQYGSAAATLGADWYDEMRELAGVPGRFRAVPISAPPVERLDVMVGVVTRPLFPREQTVESEGGERVTQTIPPDPLTAKTLLDGAAQRLVADMDRDTVRGSLILDPQARGWARQTTGLSCPFCVMLAGRGSVYAAETANFASHDNCDCLAVPVFGGDPRPVKPYVPSPKLKTQDQRDKNNRRLREYLNGKKAATGRRRRAPDPAPVRDIDAEASVESLRATLASLERSLQRFESEWTRRRIAELRRKIAART